MFSMAVRSRIAESLKRMSRPLRLVAALGHPRIRQPEQPEVSAHLDS